MRVVLAAVTVVLLTSMGGAAIFTSPVLLPLLFVAAVRSGRPGRIVFSLLAGIVAAELVWAAVLWTAGETPIIIWAVPLVALCAVATAYFYVSGLDGVPTHA
jgi:hypothetical protein